MFYSLMSSLSNVVTVLNQKLLNSYLIEFGVCYLTLCDRSYPKKLAFAYLEEIQKEFQDKYGHECGTVARPYAFVKFGKIYLYI